jgi:superfamily II DNA or RNA helicase
MFEVRPQKTASWVVNGDHVLSLVKTGEGRKDRAKAARGIDTTGIVDVTVREWLAWGKTQKHVHKLFRPDAVDFPDGSDDTSLTIEPYFLGVLLGDGSLTKLCAEVTKPDDEIRDECQRQADLHGLRMVGKNSDGRCMTWAIVAEQGHAGHGKNTLVNKMRALGICPGRCEDRFVPKNYLNASRDARMQVLAGLMDTDGHQEKGKSGYEFSSKSRQLAEDVVFLARSLGFHSSGAFPMEKGCQTGAVGTYWRVLVDGAQLHRLPVRIPRKKAPVRLQKKDPLRAGFTIVPTGTTEPFYGFTLDGDQRYLLADFTVTHNSGKTVVAAEIVRRLRAANPGFAYRIWFLAHRKELLNQTYKTMKFIAPETTCGIVQGSRDDVGKFVTIASIDTLDSRARFDRAATGRNPNLHSLVARPPSLVIIDESHRATSATYGRVLSWIRELNPNCLFLGMSATPGRTDGTALDRVFDCVAYERNAFQLIEDGFLVPPVGFRVDLNIDLDLIPTDTGEFKKAPLSKVMNQPAIRQAVVEGYQRYGDARKMLAFCVDVAHAKDLADQFRQNGIQARHVDGTMKEGDRDATLQAFAEGRTRILTSCDVLTEGYDDPSAQGVIFARPTNSQLVYIQGLGRSLRLHPSKKDALVIDCVGNSQKHKIVQLASLAGLQEISGIKGNPRPAAEQPEIGDAEVGGLNAHRIDFRIIRQRQSKWSWRETRFGWTVSIPRVGYFLLAWASADRRTADVKFHDMRDGKRDAPPLILSTALDFEMAYGLVEQEIERLFSARTSRARIKDKETDATGAARDILDEGVSGELFSPEELMRNDADWRNKPTSERQRAALVDIGVKVESVPGTAGEASDLFSVMTIERNAKMREPATLKQRQFVVRAKLATHAEAEAMTKKQAAGLIVRFLAEKKSAKEADERFNAEDEAELEEPDE